MTESYAHWWKTLAAELGGFLEPEEARAECFRWLEDGLGLSRAWLLAHGDEPVPEASRRQVETWLRLRRTGMPWAYILGWVTFRDRRFEVTQDTLIPRPETELVLEAALEAGRRAQVDRCVDVGTGTGILAISVALETDWEVTASDLSVSALDVARRNATQHGALVQFHESDLLASVPGPLGLVLSNPPYVDPADAPGLQRELSFEPPLALFAEDSGLALSMALLGQARARCAPVCVLEIGAGQGQALAERARQVGWKRVAVHQDLASHDRILIAIA